MSGNDIHYAFSISNYNFTHIINNIKQCAQPHAINPQIPLLNADVQMKTEMKLNAFYTRFTS